MQRDVLQKCVVVLQELTAYESVGTKRSLIMCGSQFVVTRALTPLI